MSTRRLHIGTWTAAVALVGLAAAFSSAEQFKQFGAWQVHYIAFNASLLSPAVAERYGIVRGRNKGLVNITAIGPSGRGEKVAVTGRLINLLEQSRELRFRGDRRPRHGLLSRAVRLRQRRSAALRDQRGTA